ncbi:MAG: exosortase C-terminal domain/associated protein EpsI [Planctomycetota bacterium]
MPDLRGKRATVLVACVVIVCAAAALIGLLHAASRDDDAGAWKGRTLGFVMGGVGLAVGIATIRFSKPGETHYWGFVCGMTMAAILTGAYSYRAKVPQAGDRAQNIPLEIKGWIGRSLPVDESTIKALNTSDIVMRNYRRGNDIISLAVIFSMGKRRAAHPPEQCYGASGYEMELIEYDTFDAGDGGAAGCKRLVINDKDKRRTAVLYWYKADELNTGSIVRMSMHSIMSDLMMSSTRIALIRLTTPLASPDDKEKAFALLKEFARDALPGIEQALQ